ncbi:thioredoxin, mitochondrial [Agrilus planipennis]|uniref:Thioredoxin, mitochondrial n=1 Tax=Agrilus planipennis TaxID=224129 RepID=A0A7F5RAB0_AGRPL|nr:thioredoxin, mitochondrial [Agrilus planipennis]XP_025832903.1 thioredoxin, mitochondrial [Agrilus planipennis]
MGYLKCVISQKCLHSVKGIINKRQLIFEFLQQRMLSCSSTFSKIVTINNNDDFLSKVMRSSKPVIVNFHAEWCEPCHILTPKMEELIGPKENIDLAVIDVENNAELVHTFEVKAVPAVIAVRDGLVVDKFIGLVDADMIERLIAKLDNFSNT